MKAILPNDICYATGRSGATRFNTDGVFRDELSIEEARSALDFKIVKKKSYDEDGRAIPGHYHLVKDTDNSFIPSTNIGEQFTPIQHLDVFDYIANDIMPKVPALKLELCGTIHGGGVGLITATYGDTFSLPGDESPNNIRLFFSNPCNGTGRMTLGYTTVRIICQNTLAAATQQAKEDGWLVKHTKGAPEIAARATRAIEAQAIAALEMKEKSEMLARIGVDAATVERCLDAIYPVHSLPEGYAKSRLLNIRSSVMEQFEGGETAQTIKNDTAWKLFNSFTYPIFNPEKIRKNQDLAEIQYSGMIGSTATKVRKMFDTVSDISGLRVA